MTTFGNVFVSMTTSLNNLLIKKAECLKNRLNTGGGAYCFIFFIKNTFSYKNRKKKSVLLRWILKKKYF